MDSKHIPLLYRFFSILLIIFVTTQCVAAPTSIQTEPGSNPASSNSSSSPQPTDIIVENGGNGTEPSASVDVPETPVPVDITRMPSLGSSTFTVDSSSRVEGEYKADGSELKLELTDSAGLTWTLVIPGDALETPQSISMTSLKDISSKDVVGNLVGGVQLEPDELQFILPATLTVSGPALEGTTILLGARQDGSQVSFLVPGDATEEVSALIYHFSSALGDNLDDQKANAMAQQAQRTYAELAKLAKEILKNNVPTPVPSEEELHCLTKKEMTQAAERYETFREEFENPEVILVQFMIAAQKNLMKVVIGYEPNWTLEMKLTQRLVTKALNMIATYGNQEDYLTAITVVSITTLRNLHALGSLDDASLQKVSQQLAAKWTKAIDALLKELVEQHEYRNVSAIIGAMKKVDILGPGTNLDKIPEKIRKALHFDLELKFTFTLATTRHYKLEANFPVEAKSENELEKLSGDGKGRLISYVHDGTSDTATAPAFSVNVVVKEFNACNGMASFTVDQFFPPSETYTTYHKDGTTSTSSAELIKAGWQTHFGTRLVDGRYSFVAIINDNSVDAVDQSFSQVYGPNETIFEIKMKHTPQK